MIRERFDYYSGQFPLLKADDPQLPTKVEQISATLDDKGTLQIVPNKHGIYPASSGQEENSVYGMEHAWTRDIVMVGSSSLATGMIAESVASVQGLWRFKRTQIDRILYVIRNPASKLDYQNRPHIRFLADHLKSTDQLWGHNQLDALGYLLWLTCRLAELGHIDLYQEEQEMLALLVKYFKAVEYYNDFDHGTWEEDVKVNSSSTAAVVAGLESLERYASVREVGPAITKVLPCARRLITQGREALKTRLPFESPPIRMADSAVLFAIYPTGVIDDRYMQDLVLHLIEARLLGPRGINRYKGDSYYCQDYDRWVPTNQLSNDHTFTNSIRNEFLQPGKEAQWCLFDPIISVIHGNRFLQSNDQLDLDRQLRFANRSLSQVTTKYKCPEMYYFKDSEWQENPHTPLLWTQANLAIAMHALRASVAFMKTKRFKPR